MVESENGKKIIERIPYERILIETDGPFIEYKGSQIKPIDSTAILSSISKFWNKKTEETQIIINSNFKTLINTIK